MTVDRFAYAFAEEVDKDIQDLLVNIPARWGRMPPLSRAVVVETGKFLRQHNLLTSNINLAKTGKTVGLIGGTRWGCHTTDLSFATTMKEDVMFASPAIFGYTLANIPLAEAANQFGLIGPVYAIIDKGDPLQKATNEARRILATQKDLDLMLACSFDSYYLGEEREQLSVTFTLLNPIL